MKPKAITNIKARTSIGFKTSLYKPLKARARTDLRKRASGNLKRRARMT